ncbi:hypothetical protein MFFC18_18800 [Mariniblastus fucicola]|uniref:Uncharacterized protein n=1 Tax=Mariniblastus fucicola TaxID=980251 RepID=A0A5B9P9A6_9BACT|nr:hypothetical protein MFFC18_18800 [Mariniblastus fucicola]
MLKYGPERGTLDNKTLNRSVLIARVGLVVGWSYLPLYPTTVFTNSILFDASVNVGVIQRSWSAWLTYSYRRSTDSEMQSDMLILQSAR